VDSSTIAGIATAGGTLALAAATFASVRSANGAARVAERSLLAGLRPLLTMSRVGDPKQKVGFQDGKWFQVSGGGAIAEATDDAVYLVISVRNAGAGPAVLHGWHFDPGQQLSRPGHAPLETFTELNRELYIPPGDIGFWQGAFRDPASSSYHEARQAIESGNSMTVEVLYGDIEGGQRSISRFDMWPRDDGAWAAIVARRWRIDAE
jgi:hypothetical protein